MRAPSPPRPSCRSRSSGDRTPTRATCMGRVGTYSVLAANDLPNLSTLAPITRALGLRLRLWRSGLGRNHVQVAGASSPPHASSLVGLAAVPFHGRLDNAARIVEYCPSSADRKSAKNRTGLCARVAVATSLSNADAAAAAGALFSAIADALARDDTVTIAGFRNFTIRDRPARTTRNPKIGEAVAIAASRAPLFKAGKTLRDAVKMVSVPVRSNPRCPQLPCHRTSTAARRGGSSDSPRTRADTPALNFRCFLIACAPSITGPAPTVTGGSQCPFAQCAFGPASARWHLGSGTFGAGTIIGGRQSRHHSHAIVPADQRVPEKDGVADHLRLRRGITVHVRPLRLWAAPTTGHRGPVSRQIAPACARAGTQALSERFRRPAASTRRTNRRHRDTCLSGPMDPR